jgi:hypothetical protein
MALFGRPKDRQLLLKRRTARATEKPTTLFDMRVCNACAHITALVFALAGRRFCLRGSEFCLARLAETFASQPKSLDLRRVTTTLVPQLNNTHNILIPQQQPRNARFRICKSPQSEPYFESFAKSVGGIAGC